MDSMIPIVMAGGLLLEFVILHAGMKSSSKIPEIPVAHGRKIAIRMDVEPTNVTGSGWNWSVYFTFDGTRSTYGASGWAKNEGTAWEQARACAYDASMRFAAEQVRLGQKRSDEVPL